MRMAAVPPTRSTAGSTRLRRRGAFREWCRLSLSNTTRGFEVLLQALVFAFQALPGTLGVLKLPTQAINFSIEIGE
jgi:hypothetical protein